MSDYEERAKTLGFADKNEIKALVLEQVSEVVFLDVRGDTEIAAEPFKGDYQIVYSPCSRTDATELARKAGEILPNKEGPIVVFCRSGARAKTAKEALESLGYKKIFNAGGLSDMDYLLL